MSDQDWYKRSSYEGLVHGLNSEQYRAYQAEVAEAERQRQEETRAQEARRQFLSRMPRWQRDAYLRREAEAAEAERQAAEAEAQRAAAAAAAQAQEVQRLVKWQAYLEMHPPYDRDWRGNLWFYSPDQPPEWFR